MDLSDYKTNLKEEDWVLK